MKKIRTGILLLAMALLLALLPGGATAMEISQDISMTKPSGVLADAQSALSGKFEKLSSDYRVNRAGEDAEGLEFSGQMREKVTGLLQKQNKAGEIGEVSVSLPDGSLYYVAMDGEGRTAVYQYGEDDDGQSGLQFAAAGDAIYASDNGEAILVDPQGDLTIVGEGDANITAFSGAGMPQRSWPLHTDGRAIYRRNSLQIGADGEIVEALTMNVGDQVQLEVIEHTTYVVETVHAAPLQNEMSEAFNKENVLIDAALDMLTTANAVPQAVLELLQ